MLRLGEGQVECLWDEVVPVEARELPEDLARLDRLLADAALLAPIEAHWRREAEAVGRSAAAHGRPTISMQTYVRLMVVKQRTGWGYETLMIAAWHRPRRASPRQAAPAVPPGDLGVSSPVAAESADACGSARDRQEGPQKRAFSAAASGLEAC
jgi:hypothetical protein